MQDKIAQKRSLLNKLREKVNFTGQAAEMFSDEFKNALETLRQKDNKIRAIVSGEMVDTEDPGSDPVSLKDLLKDAKSGLNRREFMTMVADLGRFHKKVFEAVSEISNLQLNLDKVHHEFLFKDLKDEKKKELLDLKKKFSENANFNYLIKEASIMDFFVNIGTERGKALAAWEKRYPKQIGKLKKDSIILLAKSEGLLSHIISALKEMAQARSVRNVDNYVKAADKIAKKYQEYDKYFREYYVSNIKGFLDKVELFPVDKVENPKSMENKDLPVESKPLETERKTDPNFQILPEELTKEPTEEAFDLTKEKLKAEEKKPEPVQVISPPKKPEVLKKKPEKSKTADLHQDFLNSLELMGDQNPILLKSHIVQYAKQIQSSDFAMSLQLLKLAQQIEVK